MSRPPVGGSRASSVRVRCVLHLFRYLYPRERPFFFEVRVKFFTGKVRGFFVSERRKCGRGRWGVVMHSQQGPDFEVVSYLNLVTTGLTAPHSLRTIASSNSQVTHMSTDAGIVAKKAEQLLPLAKAKLADEYYYQSLPLCIIDSVFSINANYQGVKNVIGRYCKWTGVTRYREDRESIPPREKQLSVCEFCRQFEKAGLEVMAVEVFKNRQRTSTRNGILKAEAVLQFAKVLKQFEVEHFQDYAAAMTNTALESAIRAIPGQGSGLSLGYFWMLTGSDDFVKPDRMVLRFLQAVLSRDVKQDEARKLLTDVTSLLKVRFPNLTPRLLDHEIWKYQRKDTGEGVATVGAGSPRQYSLVRFLFDQLPAEFHHKYPFSKDGVYVFFGEIPNMPGHCVVADHSTGRVYSGYHTEQFEELPEDEM